jgi:hypothetical protein
MAEGRNEAAELVIDDSANKTVFFQVLRAAPRAAERYLRIA